MGPFRPARRRCSRFARLGQLAATISPRAGRGDDFTLQWCIISEALNRSLHRSGAHAMAASCRDLSGPVSLHHNLIATCRDRHPSLASARRSHP